ncbi:hypothetical protein HQN89_16860 [Paenibacillus frigoriresistens]|uniref:hypothetical protein n=1 Tax=Paenibacillus alginolyticus TaxID=59839 RepID=UPI0015651EB4|nr:hypothetical protein [Paenibacillus frigoriresistens]NRF92667.1 hypothetical protein [Paenibacillus frigoriresistens]
MLKKNFIFNHKGNLLLVNKDHPVPPGAEERSGESVKTIVDHQTYEISYYPVSKNTTILVPANGRYQISGNSMDGIIVTMYPCSGLMNLKKVRIAYET